MCEAFWRRDAWFMLCRALKSCLDPRLVIRADAFCYHAVISVPFHFECGMRNVRLRLAVYALGPQRAMVDTSVDMLLFERRQVVQMNPRHPLAAIAQRSRT